MSDDLAIDDEDDSEATQRQGIQSVEIAMTVLLALEQGGGPVPLNEVARRSGQKASKVHRYLVSLCRAGLASQSPSSSLYDLGPAMRRLGAEALRRTNEVTIASEYAPLLRDDTGHSVNLSVWSDDGPVLVRWDFGAHVLPLNVRVGATLPLLASSAGRVFLALLPPRMTASALARSRRDLPSLGISDADVQRIETEVRETGIAATTGGVIPGIASISAPIRTAADASLLVVTVVFPREQVSRSELDHARGHLARMAQTVSRELGYDEERIA
ncbi:IclR family transcriptional regulator [uncultured Amnibacterium sp.]|uniref:IclR family transcriptional regulator n=1 Tax=uncultured Amnibacterium sp. TaxID=1631851 RepID=UPI0035C9CDC5